MKCSSVFANACLNRRVEGADPSFLLMVERLLPAEDPVLESVLKWTVERMPRTSAACLNGFQRPVESRAKGAASTRSRALTELEAALDELDNMH